MIFHPQLAKKIAAGKKTMTRRQIDGCRYHEGKSYSVQRAHGRSGICRITVIAVRQEPVGDISLADAKREGFKTQEEFTEHWAALYGSFNASERVWVLGFALGDYEDTPRLLRARPGREGDKDGDYVTNSAQALRGTAEEVSAPRLEVYSATAEENHRFIRAEQKSAQRALIASLRANGVSNRELRAVHSVTGQHIPIVYDGRNAA